MVIAVLILFLLLISAFLSGSETGMTGASTAKLSQRENDPRARRALKLQEDPERWISALLIGNNLVNILASSLATALFISLMPGPWGVIIASVIMTALVVIFAEVLPKSFALRRPETVALAAASPLHRLAQVLTPLVILVQGAVQAILRLLIRQTEEEESDEEELRGAIDLHGRAPDEDHAEESTMLASILDLDDMAVEDILTHRSDLVTLDKDLPIPELVERVLAANFTRLPVYEGTPDHIVGLIHAKNLLRALQKVGGDPHQLSLDKIMSKPWFVLETTTLLDQLRAFRNRREHFAVVIDEYGSLQGIVTLEDILEEIVGEIDDEYDVPDMALIKNADGTYDMAGDTSLRDVNRQLKWNLSDDHASTLAGYLLYESQEIPKVGQRYVFDDHGFEILERDGLQITKVRVSP